jgi:hypothetical protein
MANKKITQLTEATTILPTDILPVVINPASSPASRKITAQNLQSALNTGWLYVAASGTYLSASTFRLTGDFTAYFKIGAKIKLNNTTTKYFYVASSSYSAPNTTVTIIVNTTYTLANTTLSNVYISYAEPPDFPGWLSYTSTLSAVSGSFTSASITGKFSMTGKTMKVVVVVTITTNGTASGIGVTVPLNCVGGCVLTGRENQTTGDMLQCYVANGSSVGYVFNYTGDYINANSLTIYINGSYPVA